MKRIKATYHGKDVTVLATRDIGKDIIADIEIDGLFTTILFALLKNVKEVEVDESPIVP